MVYLESLSAMKQLSNDEKTKLIRFYLVSSASGSVKGALPPYRASEHAELPSVGF